jgi:membrane associated rhomboid family serine protease
MENTGDFWSKYTVLMVLAVPAIIITFNLCLFYRLIPEWFSLKYVILTTASPNILSMFLSNYAHRDIGHLCQNMAVFIIIIGAITWVALRGVQRTGFEYTFDTKTLVRSALVFFLVVPFIVSGISVLAAPAGMEKSVGFSGIGFAFVGYLIYILVTLLVRKILIMREKGDTARVIFGCILVVAGITAPMAVANMVFQTNYVAHVVGYVCGLLSPVAISFFNSFPQHQAGTS